jgi:hypothetical protein
VGNGFTCAAVPSPTPVPQGGACSDATECATDNCADGVCCDTACDQPLQQCNLPGQVGTCASAAAPAPAASDAGLVAMVAALIATAFVALRLRRA